MSVDNQLRRKGEKLLFDGCGLGDTSGRTKNLEEKNVFALASKTYEFSILAESGTKKRIYTKLVNNRYKKYGDVNAKTIMHAVLISKALNGHIDTCPPFYICADGFEMRKLKGYIKEFLGEKWNSNKINILPSLEPQFEKHNIADKLASDVRKGIKNHTIKLHEKHFVELKLL